MINLHAEQKKIYFTKPRRVIYMLDKLFNYIPDDTSFMPFRELKDVPSKPIRIELIKK